jgi:hypothetical protein
VVPVRALACDVKEQVELCRSRHVIQGLHGNE